MKKIFFLLLYTNIIYSQHNHIVFEKVEDIKLTLSAYSTNSFISNVNQIKEIIQDKDTNRAFLTVLNLQPCINTNINNAKGDISNLPEVITKSEITYVIKELKTNSIPIIKNKRLFCNCTSCGSCICTSIISIFILCIGILFFIMTII